MDHRRQIVDRPPKGDPEAQRKEDIPEALRWQASACQSPSAKIFLQSGPMPWIGFADFFLIFLGDPVSF
jgi:hypothetical protein